jgi:hypothetical protein
MRGDNADLKPAWIADAWAKMLPARLRWTAMDLTRFALSKLCGLTVE